MPALFPDLSLWENLNFHASMYGLPLRRRRRLNHVLDWVELDDDRKKKVREVSGGMQRRLALAATFVHDPELVFLDEPTAGIDPILRSKFWEQFREMRDEGRTMCVTTQYVGEAAYCDYVGLLSDGELLMLDTPENLRRAAFDGEVVDVELSRAVEPAELAALRESTGASSAPERRCAAQCRIVVDDADAGDRPRSRRCSSARRSPVVEAREHVVDYDEAFVRVVERHRSELQPPRRRRGRRHREPLDRGGRGAGAQGGASDAGCARGSTCGPWLLGGRPLARVRPQGARRDRPPAAPDRAARRRPVRAAAAVRRRLPRDAISTCAPVRRPGGVDLRGASPSTRTTSTSSSTRRASPTTRRPRAGGSTDGELDVVVVFPPDPLAADAAGESAEIEVLHDEIDPIQEAAIEFAARLAVHEVNASVLGVHRRRRPVRAGPVATLSRDADRAGRGPRGRAATATRRRVDRRRRPPLGEALLTTSTLVVGDRSRCSSDSAATSRRPRWRARRPTRARPSRRPTRSPPARAPTSRSGRRPGRDAAGVGDDLPTLTTIDPTVLVRPFESETENWCRSIIDPTDYFAPSSITLLLQHLALTFAALSLVRDRELGLLELLRVGPLSSSEILLGKTFAYLLVGLRRRRRS